MKHCNHCHEWKDYVDFHKNKRNPDGRAYLCKLCRNKKQRKPKPPPPIEVVPPDPYANIRPKTYSACLAGGTNAERPCPWWACDYHLAIECVNMGWMRHRAKYGNMDEDDFIEHLASMKETCCLDVANRGEATLQDIANIYGCTRERVRQIEDIEASAHGKQQGAIQKLRHYKKASFLRDFEDDEPGYYDPLRGVL